MKGPITNNASVDFNQTTTGTYAGVLSGTGSVIKDGSGNVTFSGINTYSGGTTVNGGTLTGTTDSLQGDMVNNATLAFNQTTDGTYGGNLSGTGAVTKSGTGNVTFSGTNTYSGGTTVNAGTLTGTTDSLQGNITNKANVTFDQSTSGTYAGNMSGSGSLLKTGTGDVTLSGTNSYTGGTTVNAGTLIGTTSSLQRNITNNASVDFDQSTNGTYTNVISGTGNVVKDGAGNVTFSGANTYSGGTTVNAGTLTVAGDSNLGTGGNLSFNGGTLQVTGSGAVNRATTLNSGGGTLNINGAGTSVSNNQIISGAGTLTKSGAGTLTLTGSNAYTGGTTVLAGTLTGTTDGLQGNIANSGNVTFNQSTNGTYAGNLSGVGNVIKDGSGNITFSGTNSYSGGTTVNGGTLTGTTDSLQGDMVNNANVDFNQTTTGTYAGVLSGTGSVIKDGSGNVTFSGINTYSGGTTVNGGKLVIDGSINGDTTIAAAGALGGNGTINGQVINNGLVAPGSPVGTLQINGAFASSPGSSLQIGFNAGGTTPGVNNGLLNVNGDVFLNGAVEITAATGSYPTNAKYTFLTFTGTRTGVFDSIMDNLPFMTAELIYGNGFVQFELFRNSTNYAALAQTYNQFQVATYLDATNPTGDLAFVLDQLNMQTADGARSAFQQMTGEVNGTMAQLGVQNTTQIYLMLHRQLRPKPTMSGGRYAAEADGIFSQQEESEIVLASYNPSTDQIEFVDCSNCCYPQWSGWATGYGMGGNAHGDGNAAGGVYGIGGTVFGLDRRLDYCHSGGIFGAYSGLGLNIANPNQSSKASDVQFGNYLCGDDGFNYYLLAWSAGYDRYITSRQIQFGAIDRMANGVADGWQAAAWLERGIHFCYGQCDIQPFLALQYIYLRQNSFAEVGADSLNLHVGGIDTNALRGILGADAIRTVRLRNGQVLAPELRALWLHEFLEPETSLNSVFVGTGGTSFITRGLNYGRDWAVLGGGIKWQINPRLNVFADYDLQFNALQSFHVGSGGLEFEW